MTIAFDYDGTLTADPRTMIAAMRLFEAAGHTVIIATMRHENSAYSVLRGLGRDYRPPIVYCYGHKDKATACARAGYAVDVWVDDTPEFCREGLIIAKDRDL
jgi:hypothetical protein